jgi:uncharacterized protein (TIRG00374 family)
MVFVNATLGRLSFTKATQAIYAGLFVNELFPLRPGEVLRSYLVSKWLSSPFINIIPSIVVERLFDAIWLGLSLGFVAMIVQLPSYMLTAADYVGFFVIIAVILFTYIVVRPVRSRNNKKSRFFIVRLLFEYLYNFRDGISRIGFSKSFFASLFCSPLIIIFQAISFWLVMKGYHISLSIVSGAAVFFIVNFGTAIPNTPSNIGSYQLFTVLGLSLFGIDKTTSAGFSIAVFIILTLPLWLLGAVSILLSGISFSDIKKKLKDLKAVEGGK